MYIEELDKYKVSCHISRRDLREHGITVEDLVNRTPLAHIFFKKVSLLAKESTQYEWPGCAFSMQMEFYPETIVLIFSEQIEDYVYNLRQTAMALPNEQQEAMNRLIQTITMADEEEARQLIKSFEQNVKQVQSDL